MFQAITISFPYIPSPSFQYQFSSLQIANRRGSTSLDVARNHESKATKQRYCLGQWFVQLVDVLFDFNSM